MFRVGQDVICVHDFSPVVRRLITIFPWMPFECPVVKGEYKIAAVHADGFIGLVGFEPRYHWEAAGFRPLVNTDISMLEEIARKVTNREPVDA